MVLSARRQNTPSCRWAWWLGLVAVAACWAGPEAPEQRLAFYLDPARTSDTKLQLSRWFRHAALNAVERPELALETIAQWLEVDPDNAHAWYLRACAYGARHEWGQMTTALDQGNERLAYLYLVDPDLFALEFPHLAFYRELARLAVDSGEPALLQLRAMGLVLSGSQPRVLISCLVGAAVLVNCDGHLVQLCQRRGETDLAEAWDELRQLDEEWAELGRQQAKVLSAKCDALLRRYGLDPAAEWSATERVIVRDLYPELLRLEAELVDELLAARPAA